LHPFVLQKLDTGASLSQAASDAAADAHAHFKKAGLTTLKDICSGKPGGLGKSKVVRNSGVVADASGGGDSDELS
jgi:hypothetical protein